MMIRERHKQFNYFKNKLLRTKLHNGTALIRIEFNK